MNMVDNWKSLLSQQAVTTGRPISPRQALALRQGEIAAQYQNTNEREKSALSRQALDIGKEYQDASLALGRDKLALSGDLASKQLALQTAQFNSQMALQNNKLNMLSQQYDSQALGNTIKGVATLPIAAIAGFGAFKNSGLSSSLSSFFDSILDLF